MKIKTVLIPIYCQNLHIIFSDDVDKDYNKIHKKFPETLDIKRLDFAAQSEARKNHYLVIFNIKNLPTKNFESEIVNTITHETVHIVSMLSKRINLYPDVDNDEAQAYLSGYIAGEIYKVYLNYKKKEI